MSSSLLAFDVGDRYVGIAISRKGGVSLPLGAFERPAGVAERKILHLIAEENIEDVVVGLPLDERGAETEQCVKVRNFCRRIEKRAKVNFIYVDEYLTTGEAKRRLLDVGRKLSSQKKRGAVDAVAASILLETYLEKCR